MPHYLDTLIVRPLIEKLSDTMDPDNARDMVLDVMRQVWNARGAADRQAIDELPCVYEIYYIDATGRRVDISLETLLQALDQ